jgi:hypothetical protein
MITYDRYVFPTPADAAELDTKPLKTIKTHVLLLSTRPHRLEQNPPSVESADRSVAMNQYPQFVQRKLFCRFH